MRQGNPKAVAFVLFIWIALICLMAHDAYRKVMKVEVISIPKPKTVEELLNGNS